MEKTDITIVGAGVIGLAIAAELSNSYNDIFVIERNSAFGQETSSRNSEVIHSGIYYPKDSLKVKTCVEGRQLLYEFCAENKIAHKKIGKLIVAIDKNEVEDLESLFEHGLANGVEGLRLLSRAEINKLEPNVAADAAIYSLSTGILDSHGFMQNLSRQFSFRSGQIAYNCELAGIDKEKGGFIITVKDRAEGPFKFFTRLLINCSGLNSDKISAMAGLSKEEYKLKYCKGGYFRVSASKSGLINRLVYPVPKKGWGGLGIHATLDLSGSLRLGPDDEYVQEINYTVDVSKRGSFYESARKFLPFVELADLSPDMAGIRPKLQGYNEPFRDFIIREEASSGLPGFINLIGIESLGLTASLSIAKIVRDIVKKN